METGERCPPRAPKQELRRLKLAHAAESLIESTSCTPYVLRSKYHRVSFLIPQLVWVMYFLGPLGVWIVTRTPFASRTTRIHPRGYTQRSWKIGRVNQVVSTTYMYVSSLSAEWWSTLRSEKGILGLYIFQPSIVSGYHNLASSVPGARQRSNIAEPS